LARKKPRPAEPIEVHVIACFRRVGESLERFVATIKVDEFTDATCRECCLGALATLYFTPESDWIAFGIWQPKPLTLAIGLSAWVPIVIGVALGGGSFHTLRQPNVVGPFSPHSEMLRRC
jgi:hypothetical protein